MYNKFRAIPGTLMMPYNSIDELQKQEDYPKKFYSLGGN